MKVLHLTLKKKWFDMIASGEKKEEYRELKDYWCKRFCNNSWYTYEPEILVHAIDKFYDVVIFKNGYSKTAPTVKLECKGITVGKGNKNWGAEYSDMYFVIKLGNIIKD